MKKMLCCLLAIVMIGSLTACKQEKDEKIACVTFEMTPTKTGVEDFLEQLEEPPNTYDDDECYNVTPQDITNEYGFSIYKFDKSCASYMKYDGEIYALGQYFGGCGIISLAIDDLNQDGAAELYFTYSWGSGQNHAMLGYFDCGIKQVVLFDYCNTKDDIALVAENNELFIYKAKIDMHSFVDMEVIPGEDVVGKIAFDANKIVIELTEETE